MKNTTQQKNQPTNIFNPTIFAEQSTVAERALVKAVAEETRLPQYKAIILTGVIARSIQQEKSEDNKTARAQEYFKDINAYLAQTTEVNHEYLTRMGKTWSDLPSREKDQLEDLASIAMDVMKDMGVAKKSDLDRLRKSSRIASQTPHATAHDANQLRGDLYMV
ncbi:MAG: hypothetical protein ACOY3I_06590 [Verrucomicrobiota bacterium]